MSQTCNLTLNQVRSVENYKDYWRHEKLMHQPRNLCTATPEKYKTTTNIPVNFHFVTHIACMPALRAVNMNA